MSLVWTDTEEGANTFTASGDEFFFLDQADAEAFAATAVMENFGQSTNTTNNTSFEFTTEWLDGRTVHVVNDTADDGVWDMLDTMTFSNGFVSGDDINESYTLLDNGIIRLNISDADGGAQFIKAYDDSIENAINIGWQDDYDYLINNTFEQLAQEANSEYMFTDLASAQAFIA